MHIPLMLRAHTIIPQTKTQYYVDKNQTIFEVNVLITITYNYIHSLQICNCHSIPVLRKNVTVR